MLDYLGAVAGHLRSESAVLELDLNVTAREALQSAAAAGSSSGANAMFDGLRRVLRG
jgi:hypothetical protein